MRASAVMLAGLTLVVVLTGLLVADLSIYGVHPLEVVAVLILAFLWTVVLGSLVHHHR